MVKAVDPYHNFKGRFDLIQEIAVYAEEHGCIDIDLCFEGVCLETSGLNEMLKLVADAYNLRYDQVTIKNSNLLRSYTPFVDEFVDQPGLMMICQNRVPNNTNIQHHFGSFIGRSSWDRLVLASWLDKHNAVLSYNAKPTEVRGLDFDTLCKKDMVNFQLQDVLNLISKLPIKIEDIHAEVLSNVDRKEIIALKPYYEMIFLDVVCETVTDGHVFFPTEKIFRPIMFRKPFIVFGTHRFLHHLRKLGFKTFSEFFPEEYDTMLDANLRLETVLATLEMIASKSIAELNGMYTRMQPIIEHNYEVLMNLQRDKFTREQFDE